MTSAGPAASTNTQLLTAVAIAAALTPLNSTMIAVALPGMATGFGVEPSSVTLSVITGYLLATIVCQMPAGSVADRLGYDRALTIGRWIFAAGALAAVVAPALPVVVAGRLLMAAGGSLMVPTAMALLRVAVPPERRARAFGTMGAVMGGAAAAGPAIGGLMLTRFGWRSLFLINIPLIALSWLLQGRTAAPAAPARERKPFDWLGTALLGTALVLLVAASRTSPALAGTLAVAGVALLAVLVRHERRAPAPIIDLSLFRNSGFLSGSAVIALQNLGMYSLLALVPFYFGAGRDTAGAARVSLAIVAMTAAMAISSPFGGWMADRLGLKTMVVTGGLLGAAGILWLSLLPASASPLAISLRLLVVGLALGVSTGPAQAGALEAVHATQSGMAAAGLSMLRYLGGITGTVILGYAMSGPGPQHAAMLVFVGAFVVAALAGFGIPDLRASQAPAAQAVNS
ncbi:MAG: MFS transporter [Vicinamibacterales bacterium]